MRHYWSAFGFKRMRGCFRGYVMVILLCLCGKTDSGAQTLMKPVAAGYFSLGGYSAQFSEIYGSRNNPAALSQLTAPAVGIYAEQRFLTEELKLYTASFGLATKSGNFGLHGSYFGFNLQQQSQLQLAYGRKLTPKIDLGAAIDYRALNQAGIYGKSSALCGSVGAIIHLTPKFQAGVSAYNPLRAAWRKTKGEVRLPGKFTFGMGYDASEKFFLAAEIEQEEGSSTNVNAAFHYQLVPRCFLRMGVATLTQNYFFAIAVKINGLWLHLAAGYHPRLGLSPGFFMGYDFKEKVAATP